MTPVIRGLVMSCLAVAMSISGLGLFPSPVTAAKDCQEFTARIVLGDEVIRTFKTPTKTEVPPRDMPEGSVSEVRGKFVVMDVELDTFTVRDYTLTGEPAPSQITPERTRIFGSKVPQHGDRLTSAMELELNPGGQNLVMRRRGRGETSVKIQAKDCTQGGMFQMEPEPATVERNTLDRAYRYCWQSAPDARRFFTNETVLGYDSPQRATLTSGTRRVATWRVQNGGRIGMVVGEDAVEALREQGREAERRCPHQTP